MSILSTFSVLAKHLPAGEQKDRLWFAWRPVRLYECVHVDGIAWPWWVPVGWTWLERVRRYEDAFGNHFYTNHDAARPARMTMTEYRERYA